MYLSINRAYKSIFAELGSVTVKNGRAQQATTMMQQEK